MTSTIRRALVLLGLLIGLSAGLAVPASAHPLGNFTVNRYTGIVVAPDVVTVDHVIDLAEIPTAQLGRRIDDPGTLARERCLDAASAMELTVDGQSVPLSLDGSQATTASGQGGLAIARVTCRLVAPVELTDHGVRLRFSDVSSPGQVGWREITAVGDRMTLDTSDVPEASVSDRLTDYPTDLLASPLALTQADLSVSPGGPPAPEGVATSDVPVSTEGSWLAGKADALLAGSGLMAALLALVVAVVLGASHALAPGHGKTVMAFYLTQDGGSAWRSATAVAVSVTLAHTGSVLVFALLVSISAEFVPARVYPWLTLATGALIVALGLSLLRRAHHRDAHEHSHGASHSHSHSHSHDHDHGHTHGQGHHPRHGHSHPHGPDHGRDHGQMTALLAEPQPQTNAAARRPRQGWEPWTMGLVGGLLPSPSALVLMLASVALGKAWFGGLLVLCFGIGMAMTLAAAGLLARDLVARVERAVARTGRRGGSARHVLAYGAAGGVCLIGVGLVARTAAALV